MPRLLTAICFCLPCALLLWQWQEVFRQAPRYVPQFIHLQLGVNQSAILGQTELAAAQADSQHLRVRRDAQGRWWGSNVSEHKAMLWQGKQQDNELLHGEMHLVLAGQKLRVRHSTEQGWLLLEDGDGRTWHYNGRHLKSIEKGGDASALAACPDVSRLSKISRWLHSISPFEWSRPLQIGGSVACDQRLPWSGLAPQAIQIRRDAGGFRLFAASAATRSQICLDLHDVVACDSAHSLQAREFAFAPSGVLVLGRSQFQVEVVGESLRLQVLQRVTWFSQANAVPELLVEGDAATTAKLQWQWQALTPWQWPFASSLSSVLLASLVVFLLISLGLLLCLRDMSRAHMSLAFQLGLWCVLLLLACLAYVFGRTTLGFAWPLLLYSLVLGMTALSVGPQLARHGGWHCLGLGLATSLIGLGLVNQQALGQLAADSAGMRFFVSSCTLACLCLSLLGLLNMLSIAKRFSPAMLVSTTPLNSRQVEAALLAFGLLALLAMLLEVLIGNEAGLGAWQPIELAKTALILLAAHTFTLRSMQTGQGSSGGGSFASNYSRGGLGAWRALLTPRWQAWWPYLKPIAVFMAMLLLALLSVRDFSPLVLLLGWLWGMALAWGWAHRKISVLLICLLLACCVMFAVHRVYINDLPGALAQILWSERIAVWRAPELHPFSGMQFLRAFTLMQQSQIDSAAISTAWAVPEIQNDFAASFFVARFGFAGVQLVLILQLLLLLCLAQLAQRSLANMQCGDFRLQWLAQWRFFALCGFISVLATHFVLSWGCNFGWLPVMGQPMPFLSAAGSNMLLFIFPLLVLVQRK